MDSPYVVRTLVVEDNAFWQEMIVRKLQEQRNLQVIAIVADGLEAVHNAEELQPDLVLLDIGLPRLNGIEVAKRLRKVAPAARILFVSGEPDPAIIGEALRIGALGSSSSQTLRAHCCLPSKQFSGTLSRAARWQQTKDSSALLAFRGMTATFPKQACFGLGPHR
jgi:DNA-binding NarL/FixJ family response regulator